jgi:rare lipoprotein A
MPAVRTLLAAMLCLALSPAQAKQEAPPHHAKATKSHAAKAEKKAEKKSEKKPEKKAEPTVRMVASVYWEGTRVATGRKFDPNGMTVAHRTMPFGTRLLITNGGSMVEAIVNDRGPFVRGRDIDLTRGVAKALHFSGLGRVKVAYWPPLPPSRPDSAPRRPVSPVELSTTD